MNPGGGGRDNRGHDTPHNTKPLSLGKKTQYFAAIVNHDTSYQSKFWLSKTTFIQASISGGEETGEKKCLPDPKNTNSFVARHITHLQVKEVHLYSQQALSQQPPPNPCYFSRLSN